MRYLLILSITCMLSFSACSSKSNTPTGPDFSDQNWMNDYQKILSVSYVDGSKKGATATAKIWIKGATDTDIPPTLLFNQIVCSLVSNNTDNIGTWYYYDVSNIILGDSDAVVDYSFVFSGHTYTGTITMPPWYITHFPAHTINTPYTFTWELSHDPDHQWLFYQISYKDDTQYTFHKEIDKKARLYTIPEEKLTDVGIWSINLYDINICNSSSSMFVLTSIYVTREFWGKKIYSQPDKYRQNRGMVNSVLKNLRNP
jgi:hypothetical protein